MVNVLSLFSTRLGRDTFVFENINLIARIHVRLPGQDLGLGLPFEILFDLG